MKKKLKVAGIITGIIILIAAIGTTAALAYGPASMLGVDANTLAKQMEDNEWGGDGESKLSDVDCIRKTARTYTCMGTMTPGDDTDGYGTGSFEEGFENDPRPVGYEVVVSFNGMWIADAS